MSARNTQHRLLLLLWWWLLLKGKLTCSTVMLRVGSSYTEAAAYGPQKGLIQLGLMCGCKFISKTRGRS